MNIGHIANRNGQLVGTIATLTLALSVELVAVQSNHPAAPKYEIHARNVAGNKVQIGALWEQTATRTGESYLSGNISDPSFQKIWLTAFRQQDGSYNVDWSRPRRKAAFADDSMKIAA